jgi:hypothetical protein
MFPQLPGVTVESFSLSEEDLEEPQSDAIFGLIVIQEGNVAALPDKESLYSPVSFHIQALKESHRLSLPTLEVPLKAVS